MTSYKKYSGVYYSEDGSTVTMHVICGSHGCLQCIKEDLSACCPVCGRQLPLAGISSSFVKCECGSALTMCHAYSILDNRTIHGVFSYTEHTGLSYAKQDDDII